MLAPGYLECAHPSAQFELAQTLEPLHSGETDYWLGQLHLPDQGSLTETKKQSRCKYKEIIISKICSVIRIIHAHQICRLWTWFSKLQTFNHKYIKYIHKMYTVCMLLVRLPRLLSLWLVSKAEDSRMSMADWACSCASVTGKLLEYSHSANSSSKSTFCHRLSALWRETAQHKLILITNDNIISLFDEA